MYLSLVDRPKVSVVTPVLNGELHIEQTILSVLSQGYGNIEYIVVDGGSNDGTLGIIERYADKIATIISEPDNGIADAFNKGIIRCAGDLIFIINSDDWLASGSVSRVVEMYHKFPYADVFYGQCMLVDINDADGSVYPQSNAHIHLGRYMSLCHPSVILTRDAYMKYGLFNTEFKYAMDYDLLLRVFISGGYFKYTATLIACHRPGGASWENHEAALAECDKIRSVYFRDVQ